jgi:hypothetical protein
MSRASWLAELRRMHDESFGGIDWQSAVRELNLRVGANPDNPFSLVVPGAPPPLFNGDVEQVRPGQWAMIISLNHQVGDHRVAPDPGALWDYWRNYNRDHWYPRFFHPLARLVWSALGEPDPEDPREYAASHTLFVELCPYASTSFSLPSDLIAQLVHTEPGFQLAARANRLLIDQAEPAFVLLNGSAACASAKAEFGNNLDWEYRQYASADSGKSKMLWHYEGFLSGLSVKCRSSGFRSCGVRERTTATPNSSNSPQPSAG